MAIIVLPWSFYRANWRLYDKSKQNRLKKEIPICKHLWQKKTKYHKKRNMQMSIPFTMSDVRQQAGLLLAYIQVQQFKNATDAVNIILGRRRQRKAQRRRMLWVRPRLEEARRFQHGHIHCLMPDLRYEDPSNYFNYLRVPPALFDELLDRLRPRINADFVL